MSLPAASEIQALPGDPGAVRAAAHRYTQTATAISEAAAQLRRLAAQTHHGSSDAVDALVEAAGNAADRISKLHSRYSTAGSALTTYASELEDAQRMAVGAVSARDTARGDQNTADYWAQHYDREQYTATSPAAVEEAQRQLRHYQARMDTLEGDVTSARQAYANAVEKVDRAAQQAASLISTAVDHDGMNDSWWDDFSGWVADHAGIIRMLNKVLGGIAAVLGVLSFIFPVLAPFALAAAGLAALSSLVLAATGNGSWLDFGLDMLGVLTLGVGRVAGVALKGTMQTLRASRIVAVTRSATAAGKSPLRVVTGAFNGTQAAKKTLIQKAKWLWEINSKKGIENAKAFRILTRTKPPTGSVTDLLLVQQGLRQIAAQKAAYLAATILKLPDTTNTVAGAVQSMAGKDSLLGHVAQPVIDIHDRAWSASTWRVGSH